MTRGTTATRAASLATTLIFVALSSACSSAALVQRGSDGGRFVLRGSYMPAMAQARAQMLEHCNGRFLVHEGRDSRDGSYLCADRAPSELALSSLARNPQP
jgi:hypothetical protein